MKPIIFSAPMVKAILDGRKTQTRRVIKVDDAPENKLPRYEAGDILWVRETWLKADDGYYYKADIKVPSESENLRKTYGYKWRPSIFMPREAARIFLRVTNVRVERVQEITVDDCRLEGCCCSDCLQTGPHSPDCKCDTLFYNTWNDINAKRGYGWDTNPWVWVYEFEKFNKE